MRKSPAAIVFDLDGTLADTVVDIAAALNATLSAAGYRTIAADAVRRMVGRGPAVLVERALRHLGVECGKDRAERLTERLVQRYVRQGSANSRLFDDVREGLRRLAERELPLGLCSNKPHEICVALLHELGIAGEFAAIRGATDATPAKPAPDLLYKVLDELNVQPQDAMYVGDSQTDVETARAAGVAVALVDYGYSDVPVESLGADHTISSILELDDLAAKPASVRAGVPGPDP